MRNIVAVVAVCVAAVGTGTATAGDPSTGGFVAQQIVATWNCQDKIPTARTPAKPSPWAIGHHSRSWKAAYLNKWKNRYSRCLAVLHERARQWNWQAWLPDKWRRIGVCETGLNWQHSNSSYQGAFGFAVRSWDSFKLPGYPDEAWQASPWQQYQVALAIYNKYGFSGWGCRGA